MARPAGPEVIVITLRKAAERGHADHGWLDTRHTFSFSDYYDPGHMGFRTLRVINEDRVRGGAGFPPHGHRDMEILSYVLEGGLEHRDSTGTGSVIRPGEVQRMSAGTGVTHSEANASRTEPVHFLQIWIVPEARGGKPGYEQKTIPLEERRGKLKLVASRDGSDGSLTIRQDAKLYATVLGGGESITHVLAPGRAAWLQVARGSVTLNGQALVQGDGAAIENEPSLRIEATEPAEILLFDLN